jgi:hypothetical protein
MKILFRSQKVFCDQLRHYERIKKDCCKELISDLSTWANCRSKKQCLNAEDNIQLFFVGDRLGNE